MIRAALIALVAAVGIASVAGAQSPPPYNPVPFQQFINTSPPAKTPLGTNDNVPVVQGGQTKRISGSSFLTGTGVTGSFTCPQLSITNGVITGASSGSCAGPSVMLLGGDATSCILVGGDATSCILAN